MKRGEVSFQNRSGKLREIGGIVGVWGEEKKEGREYEGRIYWTG